jgi:hypothetical protein
LIIDVSGEQIRKNIKDGEKGVGMHLDIQVIDINTCQPLKDIAIEIWAANATVCLIEALGCSQKTDRLSRESIAE